MRHIQHPQDIYVKPWTAILAMEPNAKPEKMSFLRYASTIWLDDQRALLDDKNHVSLIRTRRWQKVLDAFENSKPGEWISLEDEDYKTLQKIVESPAKLVSVPLTLGCIAFSEAVLQAPSELPATVNGVAPKALLEQP